MLVAFGHASALPEGTRSPPAPASAPRPTPPETLEPLPADADLESVLAGLEKLDLTQVDDLFDPDRLADIAAKSGTGEQLTYEEAQQMGYIHD